MKLKQIACLGIALTMSVGLFTSCGEEKQLTSEEKDSAAKISSTVNIVAGEGSAYASVSSLGKDYKITKTKSTGKTEEKIAKGDYDFAVITSIEATRLYNKIGGFKAVTTVSLGQWGIAANNVAEGVKTELAYIGSRRIYAEKDEKDSEFEITTKSKDGNPANNSQNSNTTNGQNQNNQNVNNQNQTNTEKVPVYEMSGAVLKAIMVKNNRNIYDGQIQWTGKDDFKDVASTFGVVSMAKSKDINSLTKDNKDSKSIFNLDELWQENFKNDIPGNILIVNKKFLEKRADEVQTLLNDMADTLKDAQNNTNDKLVAYNNSNRGISLIKEFMEVMGKYNSSDIGGKVPSKEFYFYK